MPNRIIREGFLDSESIHQLTPEAECLFVRLLLVVDDAGRTDARLPILHGRIHPLGKGTPARTAELLAECARLGLLRIYDCRGKPYLQIARWQRPGNSLYSKFPWSDGLHKIEWVKCETRDGLKEFCRTSLFAPLASEGEVFSVPCSVFSDASLPPQGPPMPLATTRSVVGEIEAERRWTTEGRAQRSIVSTAQRTPPSAPQSASHQSETIPTDTPSPMVPRDDIPIPSAGIPISPEGVVFSVPCSVFSAVSLPSHAIPMPSHGIATPLDIIPKSSHAISTLSQGNLIPSGGIPPLLDSTSYQSHPDPIAGEFGYFSEDGDEYENTPVVPKGDGERVFKTHRSKEARRLAGIFHRRDSTPWSRREIRAFKALGAITPEDLAMLEGYYAAEQSRGPNGRHRRDLLTLLNNFPGELDRARAWQEKTGNNSGNDDEFQRPNIG